MKTAFICSEKDNFNNMHNTLMFFNIDSKEALEYYDSYYDIDNTKLYISNGIGVNNINFRLFNTPSFNFYRLKKES